MWRLKATIWAHGTAYKGVPLVPLRCRVNYTCGPRGCQTQGRTGHMSSGPGGHQVLSRMRYSYGAASRRSMPQLWRRNPWGQVLPRMWNQDRANARRRLSFLGRQGRGAKFCPECGTRVAQARVSGPQARNPFTRKSKQGRMLLPSARADSSDQTLRVSGLKGSKLIKSA